MPGEMEEGEDEVVKQLLFDSLNWFIIVKLFNNLNLSINYCLKTMISKHLKWRLLRAVCPVHVSFYSLSQ